MNYGKNGSVVVFFFYLNKEASVSDWNGFGSEVWLLKKTEEKKLPLNSKPNSQAKYTKLFSMPHAKNYTYGTKCFNY